MSQHLDIKTSMKYVVLELDLELPEHQKQHEITLSWNYTWNYVKPGELEIRVIPPPK